MTMTRIVLHHSGGPGHPTIEDRKHYHRSVDAAGAVHDGIHPISANAPGKQLIEGRYAAHTLNLNSGSIGLAMTCMSGAQWRDPRGSTSAFPTSVQVDAFITEAARLCRDHAIAPSRRTVLTHAEVQTTLGVRQRAKWDFDYDPCGVLTSRDPLAIGDMLRAKIVTAMGSTTAPVVRLPLAGDYLVLRRGAKGAAVSELQRLLGFAAPDTDGMFGPTTDEAVRDYQEAHQLPPDGVVGRATWAALRP